jgi:hypothetical protein
VQGDDEVTYLLHLALLALQAVTRLTPSNKFLHTYTIRGADGSPYLSRTLFPRRNGRRWILHRWHRPDQDHNLHNHPWADARGRILLGGYTEQRRIELTLTSGQRVVMYPTDHYYRGDSTALLSTTYHTIVAIQPRTWTLLSVGERIQDWGFLVDGQHVPYQEYFAQRGIKQEGARS